MDIFLEAGAITLAFAFASVESCVESTCVDCDCNCCCCCCCCCICICTRIAYCLRNCSRLAGSKARSCVRRAGGRWLKSRGVCDPPPGFVGSKALPLPGRSGKPVAGKTAPLKDLPDGKITILLERFPFGNFHPAYAY
ncbi:hypothetical protein M404DRAFT_197885 [Pisolithus tinctorius Marx 270]|uniref:Secreted protein n=1 Tax=Pisolithus tinctorius Marx 270 TaxID=870435 RepID=A0A0C3PL87_PISTI|nr:hypothetical protein M404DRAFT_197885 [Pisolithus tinctorius Marx 270]